MSAISRKALVLVAEHRGHRPRWWWSRARLEAVAISSVEPTTVDARRLLRLAEQWEREAEYGTTYGEALRSCAHELRQVVESDVDSEDRPTLSTPIPTRSA